MAAMTRVEFFFDLSSPWTRLAFHNIRNMAARKPFQIIWRPFLVGGVFNVVNDSVYASRAAAPSAKTRHDARWLNEWARLAGVEMNFPSPHHPVRSVAAMRFCCALEDDQQALERFAVRAFDAYFREQRNPDNIAVLIAICHEVGMPGEHLAELAQSAQIKERLRSNTDEAIRRGAFGSPMIFVDGDAAYFGNDQLPLVLQRINLIEDDSLIDGGGN